MGEERGRKRGERVRRGGEKEAKIEGVFLPNFSTTIIVWKLATIFLVNGMVQATDKVYFNSKKDSCNFKDDHSLQSAAGFKKNLSSSKMKRLYFSFFDLLGFKQSRLRDSHL